MVQEFVAVVQYVGFSMSGLVMTVRDKIDPTPTVDKVAGHFHVHMWTTEQASWTDCSWLLCPLVSGF